MPTITALYAALAGLFYTALSLRVSFMRLNKNLSMGDGGDRTLAMRIRQHANFAEYAPITLILMGFAEALGVAGWFVHVAGIGFLLSRLGHAWGMAAKGGHRVRTLSMVVCYGLLFVLSLTVLFYLLTWG